MILRRTRQNAGWVNLQRKTTIQATSQNATINRWWRRTEFETGGGQSRGIQRISAPCKGTGRTTNGEAMHDDKDGWRARKNVMPRMTDITINQNMSRNYHDMTFRAESKGNDGDLGDCAQTNTGWRRKKLEMTAQQTEDEGDPEWPHTTEEFGEAWGDHSPSQEREKRKVTMHQTKTMQIETASMHRCYMKGFITC